MEYMNLLRTPYLYLLAALALASCSTPKDIAYLQDARDRVAIATPSDGYIRFRKGDKMLINVHSRDEKMRELFNIKSTSGGTGANEGLCYTVETDGMIDFPVLGRVKAEGRTREELARELKEMLAGANLCRDAIVTVTFAEMYFSVLGNAGTGQKPIRKDRTSIMEALAMGDLNIDGMRKNILVMRQEGDSQVAYRVDLTQAGSVYTSPVYYIQQNDVIYVEPNDKFKRNSTVMGSTAFTPTFWISMGTLAMSLVLMFVK